MRKWNNRTKEIQYLFNPAYCGKLIYAVIKRFNEESNGEKFPFSLTYLILPLLLFPNITERRFPTKYLINFINDNSDIFINYPKRAKDMVVITNETIEFLLASESIIMHSDSTLECNRYINLSNDALAKKAESFGKLLANAGSEVVIYLMLGVKP